MPSDASSGPPALAASAVYSATLVRSTCGTKYSGSELSSTMTRVPSSDSSSPTRVTRSRTSSGPIRFIGGTSITTVSTPSSLQGHAAASIRLGHHRLLWWVLHDLYWLSLGQRPRRRRPAGRPASGWGGRSSRLLRSREQASLHLPTQGSPAPTAAPGRGSP